MSRGTLSVLAILVAVASIEAQTPLTIEHLLRITDVRAARFEPGGGLVFEFERPYRDGTSFRPYARPFYPIAHRSELFVAGAREAAISALFAQQARDDYQVGTMAPGAAYLSYLHATRTRVTVGTYALRTGAVREFDFAFDDLFAPLWISRTKLLFPVISPDLVPQVFIDRMADAWRAARDGQRTTVTRIGSGRYAPTEDTVRGLVIADARTGASCRLATGLFIDRELSPDRTRLAVVRRDAQGAPDAREPVESFRLPYERTRVIVFDLDACGHGRGVALPEPLDVLPGSIGWSPSGKRLAFVARQPGSPWRDARLWTWNVDEGVAAPVDLGSWSNLLRADDYWTIRPPRFVWLHDTLIVEAFHASETGWVTVTSGPASSNTLNVTAAFANAATEVVGATADDLLVLSEGKLWAVTADGHRRRLIPEIDEPVSLWRRDSGESQRYRESAVSSVDNTLVLLTPSGREGDAGWRKTLFVDARSGTLHAAVKIPAGARILDVDTDGNRVAFVEEQHNVGTLKIADARARMREVRRFNAYLRDVVGGRPVRLDHAGPDGRARVSWLLMPPDWTPRDGPLPTVVQIYPGKANWQHDATASLGTASRFAPVPLMPHLLATHGYAVLLPSIPLTTELPRDSLPGLADAVSSAVDAAIAGGYADRDRLAIEGHSYGGYGVMGVIAETGRFKAALAMSGLYDLSSLYGIFRIDQRLIAEFGFTLPNVSGMEAGQDGMGSAPWRDPNRYARNSPLTSVERINTPVMLIHGDLDSTVSATQAEEMFTALSRLNRDAVFVRYWGEGHTLTSPANLRDLWTRRLAWYREHLGAPRFK